MPKIRILPPEIINRVAAGEVIERPASVVKELVENSLDADATEVTILLEDGGKKLISVRDNGCGIAPGELELAFHGHATSKLRDEELSANELGFSSLGFRGEALASVAAVSMAEIVSQPPAAEHPYRYRPGMDAPEPHAGAPGSCVEVRDLFYNVPARRKFLRAAATEVSHCIQQVTRIALGAPGVRFRLVHGGREVLDVAATDDLGERVRQLVSRKVSEALIEIRAGDDPKFPSVVGFVAAPSTRRRDAKEQHFFANGRWIRDRTLSHALRSAYQGFLIPGYQPIAYLFLEFPRGEIDVNVHPTKTEVRFRDSSSIYRLVHHAVRRALENLGETTSESEETSTDADPAPTMGDLFAEITGREFRWEQQQKQPDEVLDQASADGAVASFELPPVAVEGGESDGGARGRQTGAEAAPAPQTPTAGGAPSALPDSVAATNTSVGSRGPAAEAADSSRLSGLPGAGARVIQVFDTYIIVEVAGQLMIIDQHALHEKILFESVYQRLVDGVVESQRLLVPEVVTISTELMPLVDEVATLLARFGFEMEAFGPESVAVHALPSIFDREAGATDLGEMISAILLDFQAGAVKTATSREARERDMPSSVEGPLRRIAATIACKRAVKGGTTLEAEDIRSLLQRGECASDLRHCPHGRPTAVVFSQREIERLFDRK